MPKIIVMVAKMKDVLPTILAADKKSSCIFQTAWEWIWT